ncbi:MAG: M28 family metallopeptidase [Corallococcus sp.]|nr:M28 family metallopeptidase [Corallococcus sp.]
MKKFGLTVTVILIAAICLLSLPAFAENNANSYVDGEIYGFVKDFCEKFPNRQAGLRGEPSSDSVQEYLKERLSQYCDSVDLEQFKITEYTFGYNIVGGIKKSGADKQIIIGAHYDSVGQGANDNACGVAALLSIAKNLSNGKDKLPCDVVFVLFDAEENGMTGSYNYVYGMSDADKENTLVMFNLDSIANGDSLYLWCENKHTDLADLIVSKSDKLSEKPYANGTYDYDLYGYGYYERIQASDHTPFRLAGIPTALIFSGAYNAAVWDYAESADPSKNVMNTANDTFANLDAKNGAEFVAKTEAAVTAVTDAVLSAEFLTVAANQRSQLVNLELWYNFLWPTLIVLALFIALVIVVILYYRKLQKRAILGTAEVKTNKVFSTPDAEDIFTFKD